MMTRRKMMSRTRMRTRARTMARRARLMIARRGMRLFSQKLKKT